MIAVHTRDNLLSVLQGRGRVTACNRAIEQGRVTVFGGFNPSKTFSEWRWTVEVRSRYGRVWILAIVPRQTGYDVVSQERVVWEDWAGDGGGEPGIVNGDDPLFCSYQHLQAKERRL